MHNGLATQLKKHHRNIVVHNSCEICGNGVDSVNHALLQCPHARQLRSAMRQIWVLPDEEQLLSVGPQNLLVFLMDLEGDMCRCFGSPASKFASLMVCSETQGFILVRTECPYVQSVAVRLTGTSL